MRVLVTGATGFIGSHVVAGLRTAGHQVVCCVRDVHLGRRRFPDLIVVGCDFNRDTDLAAWRPRLDGVAAVVNCAGILQPRPGQDMAAIHHRAPAALFRAATEAGVGKILQLSALGAAEPINADYVRTKDAADRALADLGARFPGLDWVVLQPSLVYAADAFGGTALFRALAALPFLVPVPGDGRQPFQPIAMADLVATVLWFLGSPAPTRAVLRPVGPERLTLAEILLLLRRWLGFGPARLVRVPLALVGPAVWLGDRLGGPITTTSLRMMAHGNVADPAPFTAATGIVPQPMAAALAATPAGDQNRLAARLHFVRPLLLLGLAAVWIGSGVVTAFLHPVEPSVAQFVQAGVPPPLAPAALYAACAVDVLLGFAVLRRRWRVAALLGMLAVTAAYVAAITVRLPWLWLDPLAPMLKVLPMTAATLALLAWGRGR